MKFWDSSAIVPLLVSQQDTETLRRLYAADPVALVWWGTPVEVISALSRLEREGTNIPFAAVTQSLGQLQAQWSEILPRDEIRKKAVRLLRLHPLRAADSLQLAAAIVALGSTNGMEFVCRDVRLALAAEKEGFVVV